MIKFGNYWSLWETNWVEGLKLLACKRIFFVLRLNLRLEQYCNNSSLESLDFGS